MQSPLLNVMSAAAIKAGKGLVRDFGEVDQLQVARKGPANFVTQTDIRTEKLLQRELAKARPEFGFLLEEGGEVAGKDASHRWIIDPLDGTSNFIHAIPYFCISIGLEKRDANGKSEIVAGIIFDPIHNELFSAEKGKGAFMNSRRLTVSSRGMDEAMIAVSNLRLLPEASHKALAASGAIVRNFGAAALDLANLAAGRIDACWMPHIQPWDIAAGLLLVREAGGTVTELGGDAADVYTKAPLSSNQVVHSAMRNFYKKPFKTGNHFFLTFRLLK